VTDLDLPRLAALAEAATPGPWKTAITDDTFVTSYHSDIAEMYGDYDTDYEIMEANAAYIAAADPTTILAMIRRLQAAEAEVWARKVVEAARLQVQIAKEAHKVWDGENESRVGKMLLAMSGQITGYRPETDAIHAALAAHDAAEVARKEGDAT